MLVDRGESITADDSAWFRATATSAGVQTGGAAQYLGGDADARGEPAQRLGSWVEWSWDGERLLVRNDRLGFVPLFYAAWGGTIAVSTSLIRLLREGAPTDIDEPALSAFLRLGFFLGDDTPFTHIRALPPGAVLEWRNGRLDVRSEGPLMMPVTGLSRSQAIDRYIEVFREAVRRRLPDGGDVVLPLSGGRDSRYILLELCRAGCPPSECVTLLHPPPRSNGDVGIARCLARELDIPHVVLRQNRPRLRAELEKNLLTHFCADEHAWYLPLVDHLARTRPRIYDGLAGDNLARPYNFPRAKAEAFVRMDPHAQARALGGPNGYRNRVLLPGPRKSLGDDVAVERITQELRIHRDAPNPVGSFYLWNRTRREICLPPFSLFDRVASVSTPYVDTDVFGHLLALPMEYLVDQRFRADVLARAHPEFAHIPFDDGLRADCGRLTRKREEVVERNRALRHFAGFAAQLIRYAGANGSSRFIDRRYLRPKLLADLARWSGAEIDRYGIWALYLLQLERLIGSGSPGTSDRALARA